MTTLEPMIDLRRVAEALDQPLDVTRRAIKRAGFRVVRIGRARWSVSVADVKRFLDMRSESAADEDARARAIKGSSDLARWRVPAPPETPRGPGPQQRTRGDA